MKKTFKYILLILKKILTFILGSTYFLSAFLLAIVVVAGVWIYFLYYSYENYYLEYLDIQNKWTAVDNAYIEDINFLFNTLTTLEEKDDSGFYEEQKYEIETALDNTYSIVKKVDYSMTMKDKFLGYPTLIAVSSELDKIAQQFDDKHISNSLKNMWKDNELVIQEYNSSAKLWNEEINTFPLNYVAKVVNFDEFQLFKK